MRREFSPGSVSSMTIWLLALARWSRALFPRIGSSKRLSHSSTDRLLVTTRPALGELAEDGEERQWIVTAAELLGQLLLQSLPPAPNRGRGTC